MWWNYIVMIVIGLGAGIVISGTYVALIVTLGVYTRLEAWARAGSRILSIDTILLLGTMAGNILTIYKMSLPVGWIGLLITGAFFGMFTGCLAAALEDTVKLFPILCRRLRMRNGLPYVIGAVGLGKTVGSLVQFFIFQKVM